MVGATYKDQWALSKVRLNAGDPEALPRRKLLSNFFLIDLQEIPIIPSNNFIHKVNHVLARTQAQFTTSIHIRFTKYVN